MADQNPSLSRSSDNPTLHHVGVVVADLDAAMARYAALGFS